MSFRKFYNEKAPFKAIKTRSSKNQKIVFSIEGLTHGFGPKMAIIQTFVLVVIGLETVFYELCFGNIGQENVLYDILKRKNAFLIYEKKK